jgi:plastocyanin
MSIKSMLAAVAVISALSITLLITTTSFKVTNAQDSGSSNNSNAVKASSITVHAGGGTSTDMLAIYAPQQIQVSVGQSVTWDNPSTVAEPHTVTFILDNKTATDIVSPFSVSNSTQLSSIPPDSNSEPLRPPNQNNVVIAVNARSYIPTVIDSQGSVKQFAPPNAAYTMDGTEKYVNSGWLVPKGQEQLYPGSSNTFAVTFQKEGTYHYICQIHPWMTGSVLVK